MANRFNLGNRKGIPTGYDKNPSTDFFVPSCGIEDIDVSLFELFNKEIPFVVGKDSEATKKVPVVFASGEKWAILKKNEPLRDSTNALILPLITIMRDGLEQTAEGDVAGRGMNQQTGEIVIKRRLSSRDRGYQSLVNRLGIRNQSNVSVGEAPDVAGGLASARDVGSLLNDIDVVEDGALLKQDLTNNVIEVISLPTPQFFTATYKVTFWTQYTTHMNQVFDTFMASMLPWGQCWRLDTPKGYWFVATLSSGDFTNESNFQEVDGGRMIKWSFNLRVPGYVLATSTPGAPVPVRKYISSPTVSFGIGVDESPVSGFTQDDPYLGADDPTLPLSVYDTTLKRDDSRDTGAGRSYTNIRNDIAYESDPALASKRRGTGTNQYVAYDEYNPNTGKIVRKYRRALTVNASAGEMVYDANWDELTSKVVV